MSIRGRGTWGGEARHPDAVVLDAGKIRIRVARIRAAAEEVGGGDVVHRRVADEAQEFALLVSGVDDRIGILERLITQRTGEGSHGAGGVLVPAFEIGIDQVEAQRELLVDQHPVEIGGESLGFTIVESRLNFVLIAKTTALAGEVDHAGRVRIPVSDTTGPAGYFNALGIEGVLRGVGGETILELTHRRKPPEVDLIA